MPTVRFVVDGADHVVEADRVMRDSQLYVAERREGGQWVRVATWPRASVTAVLRRLDGTVPRWFPEDVRTSAGLEQHSAARARRPDPFPLVGAAADDVCCSTLPSA